MIVDKDAPPEQTYRTQYIIPFILLLTIIKFAVSTFAPSPLTSTSILPFQESIYPVMGGGDVTYPGSSNVSNDVLCVLLDIFEVSS